MRCFLRLSLIVLSVLGAFPLVGANGATLTTYTTRPADPGHACVIQPDQFNMVHARWLEMSRLPPNRQGGLGAMLTVLSALAPCRSILAVGPGASANTVTIVVVDLFSPYPGLLPNVVEVEIP